MDYFQLPYGVRVSNDQPIDGDRYLSGSTTERAILIASDRAYDGLQVFDSQYKKLYILTDITTSTWDEITFGSSFSSTVTGLTYTQSTGVLSATDGYSIPTDALQLQWNSAYTHSISTHQTIINGTGFVKANGTLLSYDNSVYLTGQTSHADVLVDGDFTSQGIMLRGSTTGTYSILLDKSNEWNSAYTHSVSAHQTIINGTGFVKANGTSLSYDNSSYESVLTFQHSIVRNTNTINLVGDVASPSSNYYYGTNSGGIRGFYALPTASVGGLNSSVQFNSGNTFSGTTDFTYNTTLRQLNLTTGSNGYSMYMYGTSTPFKFSAVNDVAPMWRLALSGNAFRIDGSSSTTFISYSSPIVGYYNAACELYYSGSKKFATNTAGVTVTGEIATDNARIGTLNGLLLASTGAVSSIVSTNSGTKFLRDDYSWQTISAGTVTSVSMTVPTGLSITGSPITTNGTFALTYASGYAIPTTTKQSQWDSAYTHSISAHQTIINGYGFIKASGTTLIYDDIGGSGQWTTTGSSIYYNDGSVYIGYSSDPTNNNSLAVNGNAYISGNTTLNGKLYISGLTQSSNNNVIYYNNVTSEISWGDKPSSSYSAITYNVVYNPEISTPGNYIINITTTDMYYVNISGNTQTNIIFDFSNPIIGKSLTMVVTNSGVSNFTECVFNPISCKVFGFYDATKTNAISVLCVSATESVKYWVIIANT